MACTTGSRLLMARPAPSTASRTRPARWKSALADMIKLIAGPSPWSACWHLVWRIEGLGYLARPGQRSATGDRAGIFQLVQTCGQHTDLKKGVPKTTSTLQHCGTLNSPLRQLRCGAGGIDAADVLRADLGLTDQRHHRRLVRLREPGGTAHGGRFRPLATAASSCSPTCRHRRRPDGADERVLPLIVAVAITVACSMFVRVPRARPSGSSPRSSAGLPGRSQHGRPTATSAPSAA